MPHTVVSVMTTETSYFETQPSPSAPLNFLKIASGAPRRTYTDLSPVTHPAGRPERGWVGKGMRVGGWVAVMPPCT